jgi:cytochrome c-type biogenesis protein CcmE
MKKYRKWIIGGVIVLIAAFALGYSGFMSAGTYYYEVGEYMDRVQALEGQTTRVSGEVGADVVQDIGGVQFSLLDMTGRDDAITVVYHGQLPDTFEVGRQVVVEGKMDDQGVFQASNIIAKCSSKYEPE